MINNRNAMGVSDSDLEPEMVLVRAGPFWMGTSAEQIAWLAEQDEEAKKWQAKGRFTREQPYHQVHLPAYEISRYPVTVGAYRAFIGAGGYQHSGYWTAAGWAWRSAKVRTQPELWEEAQWAGDDRLPVVGVCWYEAFAYCRWLSAISGKVYRLPTEAEWERAARGADGRQYPWGDRFEASRCNTRVSGLHRTLPVGSHAPEDRSPYGCAEMAGNVSEWTLSMYRPYPCDGKDGRNREEGESERVIRGGSWFKPPLRARTAARGMNDPFFVDADVGFRVVRAD
jgi:formylglycine-generating enzyme required for sulfatase activity